MRHEVKRGQTWVSDGGNLPRGEYSVKLAPKPECEAWELVHYAGPMDGAISVERWLMVMRPKM